MMRMMMIAVLGHIRLRGRGKNRRASAYLCATKIKGRVEGVECKTEVHQRI